MKIYRPHRFGELMVTKAYIRGPKGTATPRLLIDTGSTYTVIAPAILRSIGCDPATATQTVRIFTGSRPENPPYVKILQLSCLGQVVENMYVLAHSLPPEVYVDGLLGMDFLRRFPIELRPYWDEVILRSQ